MSQTNSSPVLKIFLHLIFFLSGIATVLIGQVLPIMARHFALDDLQLSYFFPAQFTGSICGTFINTRFARRGHLVTAASIGGLAMVAGLMMMNAGSFAMCLGGFFINGIGIGLTLPAINMMVLEMNADRSASALSVLNLCWGIGAIVSKPFVDLFSTHTHMGLTTWVLAAPLLVLSIAIVPSALEQKRAVRHAALSDGDDVVAPEPIWRSPLAWAIALFNFIHVGFESGMGGWLTTYTDRLEGAPLLPWVSPTLLYFLLFVAGRGIAPVFFRFLDENRMLFLGLAIVLAGIALTLAASTVVVLSMGASVAGFGTSWIFPTNVSRFSKIFGPSAIKRATPLFVCGTLGAAWVTWLIGFLSDRTGSLRSGMYVLVVSVILLIILQIGLGLASRAPKARVC